jgi:hypothetical protein
MEPQASGLTPAEREITAVLARYPAGTGLSARELMTFPQVRQHCPSRYALCNVLTGLVSAGTVRLARNTPKRYWALTAAARAAEQE